MKRVISFLMAAMVLTALAGCARPQPLAAETAQPEPAEETAVQTEETEPIRTEEMFLKVSSITFSLVGEQEDIYLGLLPRELVQWQSDDPSVVSVSDGVLTAVGVGSTVIHASYYDRQVSCTASCLAQTREALESLAPEILAAPKCLPPEVDLEEPCTYFDNAALVGDSITYFLWQFESQNNYLGDVMFLTRNGVSINSIVRQYKNICFEGVEMDIEKIVEKSRAERIYILLGCLDFQVPAERINLMDNWNKMLDRIEEHCPDVEIVLISNIPSFTEETEPTVINQAVAETTVQLKQLAKDRSLRFLDLGYYIQDHYGRMPEVYCKDTFHMNHEGSLEWIKILRYYARFEEAGGSLFLQ